jgi:pimeloyl-ACP methyl ester carboxylesterase
MADRISRAELAIIPEAAHLSNLEKPRLFNETVRSFAANVPR